MLPLPPRSTRTVTLCPYTTLFLSLRTQAERTAVRKLSGCVPHDNCAIDSVQEGFRLFCVLSHDGVGVMTAMRIDMRHRLRNPVDHTRGKDAVEIFRIPVRVLSRFYAPIDCADRCIPKIGRASCRARVCQYV